ncbi:hypothetical protein ID47_04755 [Candidatus Paracaedibacter acanthamoebae]|uniref:DUF637 domain-containing protein n=2 Tax=Candidatus Odyssella acanthamoebae TaxID=91604 RepID=A0A077AZQ1_9PROT|nr:hypothetical protein ID47_04755 [Candidatus Paracaedibacter acanthamoebae]
MHAGERTAVQVNGLLTAASSSITSDKGPTVVKAKALNAQTLIETIYTDSGYYQRAQRQTAFGSTFEKLFVHIETDALANGVSFYGTAADIKTGGSRQFGAIPLFAHSETKWKKKTVIEDSCRHLRTTVTVTTQSDREAAQAPVNLDVPIICFGREATEPATFYEVFVPGVNNDCGFNCLGISRQEAVEMLLACQDVEEARAMVAPEIAEAFDNDCLDDNTAFTQRADFQILKAQKQLRHRLNDWVTNQLNESLGLPRDATWRETYCHIQSHNLQATYPEFMEEANRYLSFDEDLQTFAHNPEVYTLYIQTYAPQLDPADNKMLENLQDQYNDRLGRHEISSSVFDLLARLLDKKLRVITKMENGHFKLTHEDDCEGEPITVLHTVAAMRGGKAFDVTAFNGALNHYNLLLTDDKYTDFLTTVTAPSIQDGEISVYSEGDALDIGMLTIGTDKIFLGASGSYAQEPVYDWYQRQEIKKKRRFNKLSGFAKTRRLESKHTYQVARPCTTISTNKKEIDLYGGKGVSLRGSVLQGGKLTVEAKEGLIHLLTTMGMDCVEVKKSSKDPLWQSKSQSFEYHENRQQCQFHYDEAQGGIEFKTPEGIVVELVTEKHSKADGKKNKGRPQEWQRLKDFSNTPGYEWIKLLDEREDVVRLYVDERHDSGRFAHQGMTAAAKIIITIIITLCTAGGGLASLGATGGTAAAGGAAASTVTFSSVVSSMAMGALQGGLAAASNQLMFSMINNRLNMKNVSREMTSSSTLNSIGQSAMTAGLGKGLSCATGIPTAGLHGFEEQAWGNAITALARLGTGLAFGEKPKDVLKSTAVNYAVDVASGTIANKIGDWRLLNIEKNLLSDYVSHKLMHGALGAASRSIAAKLLGQSRSEVQKSMLGGALGAMAAEVVAEGLRDHLQENCDKRLNRESDGKTPEEIIKLKGKIRTEELTKICAYGELAATVLTQACGGDLEAACSAARNALDNNFSQMMAGVKPANFKEGEWEEVKAILLQVVKDPSEQPDPLTDTLIQELRHFLKDGIEGLYKARQRLLEGEITDETIFKSAGATALDAIGLAYMVVDKANGGALSALVKTADLTTNVVGNTLGKIVEHGGGSKRTVQNTAEIGKIVGDIAIPLKGKPVGYTAKSGTTMQAVSHIEKRLSGLDLAGFVKLPGKNKINSEVFHAANHNRLPFEITRSANATRIYEDIRAVANGSNSGLGKNSVNSAWTISSSSKGSGLFTSQHGSKPPVTAEQWIQKTIPGKTITHRGSGTGTTPKLGRDLLTGKMEAKGKEVVRDNRPIAEATPKAANAGLSSSIGKNKNSHPRVRPINNRKPINSEYAGKTYPLENLPEELRRKYPHSVPFTGTGHPDFSRYAIKKVKIKVTGDHGIDFPAADKAAGLVKRPKDYTWHHHEEGKSMYLIPKDIHKAVRHTGGVAVNKTQ